MKKLICGSLTALILTTSAAAIAAPAKYEKLDTQKQSQIASNISVPHITASGVRNDTHFIRLAIAGMSVQDLMITLPYQMERFEKVQIKDQSGREIPAKTQLSQERLTVTFDQPIAPGGSVEVQFTGIKTNIPGSKILLYGITAQRVGLQGDIPVGTARIDVPGNS